MNIKFFFDSDTSTYTYIISDNKEKKCAIIDSVLGYDQFSGTTSTQLADLLVEYIKENNFKVDWILETHIHADHLSASQYLKEKLGGKIAIGENVTKVAKFWSPIFNDEIKLDGSDFDKLLKNNEVIKIGSLELKIIFTPGHTPACCCFLVEDAIFVGDTIFQPYVGTARCDFPGGSAKDLYSSVQKILSLDNKTRIFVGHDYPIENNQPSPLTSVLSQKENNIMIKKGVGESQFISLRNRKDKNKAVPKLLIPSIQFNLRAGSFGRKEVNGIQYVKIPVNKIN